MGQAAPCGQRGRCWAPPGCWDPAAAERGAAVDLDGAGLGGDKAPAAGEADDARESAAGLAVSNRLYGDGSDGVHETGTVPVWLDARNARSTTSSS